MAGSGPSSLRWVDLVVAVTQLDLCWNVRGHGSNSTLPLIISPGL